MYLSPYYCANCEHEITEIVVRSATVVRLSCKSCHTKYFQCRYCNTEEFCHKKYHRLNTNYLSRTTHYTKILETKGYVTHLVYR